MRSEGRHSQSIRSLATVMALVMGGALLAGCASGGDEGASASGADQSYPNLGDIPERPTAMTEEERASLEQGLVADSEGREYSEEVIGFQSDPAEPLPAPMETSAGGPEGTTLGEVTMPDAVTPPFSGGTDVPPSTFDAPSTPTTPAAPEIPAASDVPATPPAPTVATPPAPTAATSLSPAAATPAPAPIAATPPAAPAASSAAAAAAAAQSAPNNIPVPPDDPMARAVTPPFSGANPSVAPAAVPPPPATAAPSASSAAASRAPYIPPYTPSAAYTPVPDASGAVPSTPTVTAGDVSTTDLNRAQMDNLQPAPPPFSGTTGATPGSYAPTQLPGPAAGTRPTAVTSAYAPSSAPTASAPPASPTPYTPPSATAAATPSSAPTGYTPPSAAGAYAPPPAAPASAPPAGVQDVFEARLQDPLPGGPMGTLPSGDELDGGEPLTTVVVSSTGVATFEELPVNVPVLEREPVPAAAVGGPRGSLARKAVPGSSVKVATILFADGSSSLRDREREIVRQVYERYLASGRKVRVVGHSSSRTRNMDPVRHRMVNFGISAERANAVATELQRLGVPSEQITVVAAADDMPMYYEVMPSGEAGNRRTEIYLD